ncbi:MAG TPA: hypothetical protein DCX01_00605 [Bacteroidetes bacterium]|nr:hypothetical protein [Bacteroidota bacterium]
MDLFFESVFSVAVGFIGLLVTLIMFVSQKSNKYVNIYLAIIFLIASFRSILYGFSGYYEITILDIDLNWLKPLPLVILPLSFLYFKSLLRDEVKIKPKVIVHFWFPLVLLALLFFQNKFSVLPSAIFYSIFLTLAIALVSIYTIKNSFFVYKLFKADSSLSEKHIYLIKEWVTYAYVIITAASIRVVMSMYFDLQRLDTDVVFISDLIKNIILLLIYIKLLVSPEILFGYPKLKARLSSFDSVIGAKIEHWDYTAPETSNIQDSKLTKFIVSKAQSYIAEIDEFIFKENPFREPKYSLTDLSQDLNIPSSHLSYIFKYHCNVSFVEYRNYRRIKDALSLIENNFLASKTFEALAKNVGFTSYNPFFRSFKKQTNYSPKEYLEQRASQIH